MLSCSHVQLAILVVLERSVLICWQLTEMYDKLYTHTLSMAGSNILQLYTFVGLYRLY